MSHPSSGDQHRAQLRCQEEYLSTADVFWKLSGVRCVPFTYRTSVAPPCAPGHLSSSSYEEMLDLAPALLGLGSPKQSASGEQREDLWPSRTEVRGPAPSCPSSNTWHAFGVFLPGPHLHSSPHIILPLPRLPPNPSRWGAQSRRSTGLSFPRSQWSYK